jgi:hypothetical protein
MPTQLPPQPSANAGQLALTALLREKNLLAALEVFRAELGDAFSFNLLGFNPIMLSGPEANRFLLVEQRDQFSWCIPTDPVAKLLRKGVLVTDGAEHDQVRRTMQPSLHKKMLIAYVDLFRHYTDQVTAGWQDGQTRDMLIEMRRLALLILVGTLFRVDFTSDIDELWPSILKMLKHISPGLWMFWTNAPTGNAAPALNAVDEYLYDIIKERREENDGGDDMLSILIESGMDGAAALFAVRHRRDAAPVSAHSSGHAPHLERSAISGLRSTRGQTRQLLDLSHAPQPESLARSGRLQSRSILARKRARPPTVHLFAVWRRPAQLHRRGLCASRSEDRHRTVGPDVRLHA